MHMNIIGHIIKPVFILTLSFCVTTIWAAETASSGTKSAEKPASATHRWHIQHWKTPSGIPVYFIETRTIPMVDIQVVFKAGSAYDGPQYGLANLTNSLLNQGTKKASADQIAEQWDMSGAMYYASINQDMAVVGMRSLTYPKQFDRALSTLKTVISQPTFPMDAFKRLQKQMQLAIKQQEQSPDAIATKHFFSALYGQHPYGHSSLGEPKTLMALKPEDVQKFYDQYYVAQNAMVAMVGNLTLEAAKKVSAELTEGLKSGRPAQPLPPAKKNGAKTQHIAFPSNQTHLIMGQIALSKTDPDYFPLVVANDILGGGMNSRLFKQVRGKHGFAYQVRSAFAPTQEKGPFYVNLQTESQQAPKAVALVKKILKEFMEQGPTQKELTTAKDSLVKSFVLQLSSNQATLSSLVNIGFYGLPLDYLSTYQRKIESVTPKQIEKAMKTHLIPDRFVQITVGKDGTP